MSFQRRNETALTYQLKWAAWEWLYAVARCRVIGFEVRLEGPGGRIVDVAGVGPDKALYVVEVKSSRGDFRRDDHDARDRERLREREAAIDRMTGVANAVAVDGAAHQATLDVAMVEKRLQRHEARAKSLSTKFHDPRFVRIADYNYVMAPRRVVRRVDLPPLWGLLAPSPKPEVVVEAPRTGGNRPTFMYAAVLTAIARANTRDMMQGHGVTWGRGRVAFPVMATESPSTTQDAP